MKTASFQYKCRQCGEIESNPQCGEEFALEFLVAAIDDSRSEQVHGPRLHSIHYCREGNTGVSDLIGYKVGE